MRFHRRPASMAWLFARRRTPATPNIRSPKSVNSPSLIGGGMGTPAGMGGAAAGGGGRLSCGRGAIDIFTEPALGKSEFLP